MTQTTGKSINRVYAQVVRADGTVEDMKLVAYDVQHPNPLKRLLYILKERMRNR